VDVQSDFVDVQSDFMDVQSDFMDIQNDIGKREWGILKQVQNDFLIH